MSNNVKTTKLQEGPIKKGGQNPKPTTPRPAQAPSGQAGKPVDSKQT